MKSLLQEVNANITVNQITESNINSLKKYLNMSTDQLNETVTTWLSKVRNSISSGKFNPNKKDAVAKILGVLSAISNPDLADALDEKGDLGTLLFNISNQDPMKSEAALQRLLMLGNHPSIKTFVADAAKYMDNPEAVDTFTKKIQANIERVMNKKLAMERKPR